MKCHERHSMLKGFLEATYLRFHTLSEVEHDPLRYPRRFRDPMDAEVAAFIAASFAFGRVTAFLRVLESLFARLGEHPAAVVARLADGGGIADGLVYRFVRPQQIDGLLRGLGRLVREGGLERAFAKGLGGGVVGGLQSLARTVRDASEPDPGFLVSDVAPANAAKRLNMFLRWMVRDDGLDLGLWRCVKPSDLLIPLDVHVFRIAQLIGLLPHRRSGPRLADALMLTEALRAFDSSDPVRYDFALSHLGISRTCVGAKSDTCARCPLRPVCRVTSA